MDYMIAFVHKVKLDFIRFHFKHRSVVSLGASIQLHINGRLRVHS